MPEPRSRAAAEPPAAKAHATAASPDATASHGVAEPPAATSLPELLDSCAAAAPDREALVVGSTRVSYGELAAQSHTVGRALAALGVGEGAVVALMAPNIAEWIPAAFGAMRCGARVDAFNTWVKAYDLDFLLGASGAEVLIMVDRVRGSDLLAELRTLIPEIDGPAPLESERLPKLRHVVVIGSEVPPATLAWADLLERHHSGTPVAAPELADAPAYVLYTSGSTSKPKAVPLCHRDLIVNAFHIGERLGLGDADRVWFGSPLFWSYGCANAAPATMTHGACLVVQEQFTATDAAALMAREQVTAAYLLPPMIDALGTEVAEQIRAVGSLTKGATIGRPDTLERAARELGIGDICNIYGSTETYGNCCVTDHRMPLEARITTQGAPLPGVAVRIVDERTGEVLPAGSPGEAQVRGRITPGYLGNDEANAAAFTADGWFRTGDRLVVNVDGAVAFVDRATDVIKTSGINVSPAEVESFLAGHPDVREVLVVGSPHPSRDEVAVAFVIPRAPGLTPDEVIAYCRSRIAGYKVPWLVSIVGTLPRTGTGKLARRLLREDAAALVDAALESSRAGAS